MGSGSAASAASLGPGYLLALLLSNLVTFIISLIVGLVAIMAVVNMAYNDGDLGAAFRFSDLLDVIATIGWGKYIITYIVIAIVGTVGVFIGVLTMFLLIGFLLLPLIILPYLFMFEARAFALLFADAVGEVPEAPVEEQVTE
jgi:hypothetical protein